MRKLHEPHLQISHAAIELYAAQGPKGFTMRRLAATLGIAASALYRHFKNKEAIIDAVAQLAEGRLTARLETPKKQRLHVDRAEAMSERALQFAVDQPRVFQLISRRKPPRDGEPHHRPAVLRGEVGAAIERGQLKRDDPLRGATALWSQFCGLVALRERGELETDEQLKLAWRQTTLRLLRGIKAPLTADNAPSLLAATGQAANDAPNSLAKALAG